MFRFFWLKWLERLVCVGRWSGHQGMKAGQGCWDLQGSTWVFICIWGEVFLLCRTGQMPRAGEQQECLGFRAGWHFRMRLPANSCDYKMPVIKLKILCHFLSTVFLPVQWPLQDRADLHLTSATQGFPSPFLLHFLPLCLPLLWCPFCWGSISYSIATAGWVLKSWASNAVILALVAEETGYKLESDRTLLDRTN